MKTIRKPPPGPVDPLDGVATAKRGGQRRAAHTTEIGPRPVRATKPIDYQTPGQTFDVLYVTLYHMIKDCGACSRLDLSIIPALSRYSLFQLDRALLTAQHHGLLRRVGTLAPYKPEDDPLLTPGVYDIDPLGLIDRTNSQAIIARAIAQRSPLEISWLSIAHSTSPSSKPL